LLLTVTRPGFLFSLSILKKDYMMYKKLLPFLFLLAYGFASAEESVTTTWQPYIEFLWSKTDSFPLARQQTGYFVEDGKHDHQVCVASLSNDRVRGLIIEAVDAAGTVISRQRDDGFTGVKRCYNAELGTDGVPGKWTYRVYFDGDVTPAGSDTVEVALTLEGAPLYVPSSKPYVLGRPDYDPTIPPEKFYGRLVWVMHVDATGKVTSVDIEVAEGVGEQMKERAIQAGLISLFPPDPSRGSEGITYRRELNFRPDQ
jgi:hypothetical protein